MYFLMLHQIWCRQNGEMSVENNGQDEQTPSSLHTLWTEIQAWPRAIFAQASTLPQKAQCR